ADLSSICLASAMTHSFPALSLVSGFGFVWRGARAFGVGVAGESAGSFGSTSALAGALRLRGFVAGPSMFTGCASAGAGTASSAGSSEVTTGRVGDGLALTGFFTALTSGDAEASPTGRDVVAGAAAVAGTAGLGSAIPACARI